MMARQEVEYSMVLSTHGDVIQIIAVHEYWYEQVIFRRERDQNL